MYVRSRPGMAATKAEQGRSTRQKLERVGRGLFAARGFAAVSAEELVAAAGVTRGALYHHYDGKEGLFLAVLESVMRDLHERLVRASRAAKDPVQALEIGIAVFLKECTVQETQRILLIDGPAVLGWARWREMDARYGLGLLRQGLSSAMARGMLRRGDPEMESHVLLGALTEAAMVVARSTRPVRARRSAEQALRSLITGWKTDSAG